MSKPRNIIGIIFYVAAAFFIYSVGLLAFINIQEVGSFKFAIMGVFFIPALVCILLGAAAHRFRNWKTSAGTVFLCGAGFNLLVVMMIIALQMSPEMDELMPDNNLSFLNDYFTGFITMAIQACIGGLLLLSGRKKSVESKA